MSKKHLPTNCCVSAATLASIRYRNPLRLQAWQYGLDKWEIGHGNRSGIHPDLTLSPCQAEDLLRNDVMYVEAMIRLYVARTISDGVYQALVSLLFDVGPKSGLVRERIDRLHCDGPEAFYRGLEDLAAASRFDDHVGRLARNYELSTYADAA